jgi:tRNA(fMet)-specific endonuclease VapC
MFILDTDHLTILEQPGGPARQRLVARLAKHPPEEVATTVITYEEQTRGWFSYLARAKSLAQELAAYDRLLRHVQAGASAGL